jgi:hypothetical protein
MSHRHVTIVYGALAVLLSGSVLISIAYRAEIGLAMFPVVVFLTINILAISAWRGVLFGKVG